MWPKDASDGSAVEEAVAMEADWEAAAVAAEGRLEAQLEQSQVPGETVVLNVLLLRWRLHSSVHTDASSVRSSACY